jgi:tRNA(fMet)-specific endonuclease VapC
MSDCSSSCRISPKLRCFPFADAAADIFKELRARRVRIGTMDLRIAAIALSRDLTMLSRNVSDFRKVPGLKVEDWTAP